MEHIHPILVIFFLTTVLENSTGQVLSDERLLQDNSCYGSHGNYSYHHASCSANHVMAISRVRAGARLLNSSCPIELNENTTVDFENCCNITAADCAVHVNTTIWQKDCSGKDVCLLHGQRVDANCTAMFVSYTSNMQLDYYCINSTRIGSTCTQVTMATDGNALYLWSKGYSLGRNNTDTNCVCSIEVESCSARIEVTAMRIDLQYENGTCMQNLTFSPSDGNPECVIGCSQKYDITFLFTSKTNYVSMKFISARNNTSGLYWIHFKATEAASNLQVNCNPAVQQMFCTTTSTTTTSTTTTTTTPTTTTTTTSTTNTTTTPPTTTWASSTTLKTSATTTTNGTIISTSSATTATSTTLNNTTTGPNSTIRKTEEESPSRVIIIAVITSVVVGLIIIVSIVIVYIKCFRHKRSTEEDTGNDQSEGIRNSVPPESTSVRGITQVEMVTAHPGHKKKKKRKEKKKFAEKNQDIDNKTTADSERPEGDASSSVMYVEQPMQDKTQKKRKKKRKKNIKEFDDGNRHIEYETLVGTEEREGNTVIGDSLVPQPQTETQKKRKNKKNRISFDPDIKNNGTGQAISNTGQEYKVEGEFDNKDNNLAIRSQLKEHKDEGEKKRKRKKHKKRTEDIRDDYNGQENDELHPSRSRVSQDTNVVEHAEVEERRHNRKIKRKHKRNEYSVGGQEDPSNLDKY